MLEIIHPLVTTGELDADLGAESSRSTKPNS
jgi:hypothetical protein